MACRTIKLSYEKDICYFDFMYHKVYDMRQYYGNTFLYAYMENFLFINNNDYIFLIFFKNPFKSKKIIRFHANRTIIQAKLVR